MQNFKTKTRQNTCYEYNIHSYFIKMDPDTAIECYVRGILDESARDLLMDREISQYVMVVLNKGE